MSDGELGRLLLISSPIAALQGSGSIDNGMLPRLIEEYETQGKPDPEQELNIKAVAALTYAGTVSYLWLKTCRFTYCYCSIPKHG